MNITYGGERRVVTRYRRLEDKALAKPAEVQEIVIVAKWLAVIGASLVVWVLLTTPI